MGVGQDLVDLADVAASVSSSLRACAVLKLPRMPVTTIVLPSADASAFGWGSCESWAKAGVANATAASETEHRTVDLLSINTSR